MHSQSVEFKLTAQQQGPWINGAWVKGEGMEWPSVDPATGSVLAVYQAASAAQVNEAVEGAWAAFPAWSLLSLEQRLGYCRAYQALLKQYKDTLAALIAEEHGKPLWEAQGEVGAMIGKLDISLDAYQARTPTWETDAGRLTHRPLGAVAILGPYNIPAHLMNGHFLPALMAGNTCLIKPSEWTPRVGAWIAKLWEMTGLPPGVFQLLPGGRETGEALAAHPRLAGLYFTGSVSTGLALHRLFAGHPEKMLVMEMGGNNPLLVWGELDESAFIYNLIQSAFLTTGQRCTCARRVFLHAQHRPLVTAFCQAASRLAVGAWNSSAQPFMGPVIGEQPALQLRRAQEKLLGLGAQPLLTLQHSKPGTGFVTPAVLDVTKLSLEDWPDEEYFGPFLQIRYVESLQEAIHLANHTRYGLSSGLFSKSRADFDAVYPHIKAGILNWNCPLTGGGGAGAVASSHIPFGGVGLSGNFRPTAYYAADSMAYPVTTQWRDQLHLPERSAWSPGIVLS